MVLDRRSFSSARVVGWDALSPGGARRMQSRLARGRGAIHVDERPYGQLTVARKIRHSIARERYGDRVAGARVSLSLGNGDGALHPLERGLRVRVAHLGEIARLRGSTPVCLPHARNR